MLCLNIQLTEYSFLSTASRYISLFDINGDDDFFSSDLSDNELKDKLGHVGKLGKTTGLRLLAAYSNKDEYVPESIKKDDFLNRLVTALNNGGKSGAAEGLLLENANHNLSDGSDDKRLFVKTVGNFLRSFGNV